MFQKTRLSAGLALAFGSVMLSAVPAMAQEAQRVEITGSSIKRIDAETALPVTVIKREEIEKTGATSVQELVDRISSNNGGGRSLGESIGESSASGQTGASLRGLGRERTLVLLNGRRLSAYPFQGNGVDLNAIPLSAIERVEILRDGASAIYGSDALSGVMNFITRKDLTGGEVALSYEQPQAKGGKMQQVSGAVGVGDLGKDRFNIFGTLVYQKYDVIKAADRDYASTGNRPDIGIVKTSGNTFPANAWTTAGVYVPGAANYPVCAPPDSFPTSNCRYDYTHYIDLFPESERLGALARGTFQLNADNQLFAEAMYSENKIKFGLSQTPSVTTGKPRYRYPGGGKWYPTDAVNAADPGYTGDLILSWRMVDGGQRRDQVNNDMTRLLVGAEGTLGGWDYKTGLMRVESKAVDSYIGGYYSDSRLVTQLATGLINPFGPNDAEGLAALKAAELTGDIRTSKTTVTALDAQISRDLMPMGGGALSLALGADMRKETYHDGYSALAASGDIVGGSGNAGAVDGKRSQMGLFAELNIPVMKGLEFQAAVRGDRYSNTSGSSRDGNFSSPDASAVSPKIGMRFQPMKEVLVRASVGKGFRAPGLDSLFAPYSDTNTGGNFNDPFYNNAAPGQQGRCDTNADTSYCDTQLTARQYAEPNLKPEKSDQFSLGVVLEPVRDLSVSLDYFDIKIKNGITFLDADTILKDWYDHQTGATTSSSVYADRLVVDPGTGYLAYVKGSYANIGKMHVAGFDLSASYKLRTQVGVFTPGVEATLLTKSTQTNVISGVESDTLGQYVRGGPAIKLKTVWTLDWTQGAWGAGLNYFRQGGYTDYDGTSHVKHYDLLGLNASYKGIKNLTLAVGVRNVLDQKPPVSVQEDYFQVGFDPTYTDVRGRSFYLRGTYKF